MKIIKIKQKIVLLTILIVLFSFNFAQSQSLTPINIDGFVFLENGTGADNGILVLINNTNTNTLFQTEVFAPPIPSLRGFYSTTIQGSINDVLILRAYNDTHYGEVQRTITQSSIQVNITMNITRPPELNVTITSPLSNDVLNLDSTYNVSVNITSLIATANACDAQIIISDTNIIDVTGSDTNFISEILKDETVTTLFEIETKNIGSVNITVEVSCDNDAILFIGKNKDTVFNIGVGDEIPPEITIVTPLNNTEEIATNNINFTFIVNDDSPIDECRLYVNETLEDTMFSVSRGVEQVFSLTLANGFYTWEIECDDSFDNTGSSGIYNLNISVFFPVIENIDILGTINLNPGTTKEVVCNVNVSDGNGIDDISLVQAILHLEGISDFSQNNNQVYIDNNCNFIGQTSNLAEYSCSFNVQYYANNGTWLCNVTATDNQGLQGNDFEDTIIDELYAINLSALQIDFGDIPAGSISDEREVDVFNIGNMPLNIFVRGYGGDDPVLGDGFAMLCSDAQSVPVGNQRFSNTENILFNDKSQLSSSFSTIISNLEKQTTTSMISQTTYWELLAPPISVTDCEGTIVFSVTG